MPPVGVPVAEVPAEEGEVEEEAVRAVVLVCSGLGAAFRCDLGERRGELRFQYQHWAARERTNLFPRSKAGAGGVARCWAW